MEDRLQIVSIVAAAVLLLVVLELVRRRRLLERYALLWLGSALLILGLAIWRQALDKLAETLGIFTPVNALFLVAVGGILVVLLHFSVAVSRLTDQTKVLAQRFAITEARLRRLEGEDARTAATAGPDDEAILEADAVEDDPRRLQRVR